MKTNLKKLCVLTLSFIIIVGIIPISASATNDIELRSKNAFQSLFDIQLDAMLNERADLIRNGFRDTTRLQELEEQLSSIGVEFLTDEEVALRFPDAKAAIDATQTNQAYEPGISAHATPPQSNVNLWTVVPRVKYTYNGTPYDIQRLRVEYISEASPLWISGAVDYNVEVVSVGTALLRAGSSIGISKIPILSDICTLYDALKGVVSDLSHTSEVRTPSDMTYEWEVCTTVVFSYVKKQSQTDDYYQVLSHISSSCEVMEFITMRNFDYRQNSAGTWVRSPSRFYYDDTQVFQSDYYNNVVRACWAYENARGQTYKDTIGRIDIAILNDDPVSIYPCDPYYPAQCE